MISPLAFALGAFFALGCASADRKAAPDLPQAEDPWFRGGEERLARVEAQAPIVGRAKNVILFVGDGLDVATVTAARIYEGQQRGEPGEENLLSFEALPHRALLKTYNTNQQVADSAGAATALFSGVKTKAGVIGLDSNVVRGECGSAKGHEASSLFELAQRAGLATGVVTTARLTHATPAAAFGHTPERDWELDADLPARAIEEGCTDLARQFVEGEVGPRLEVALAGGRGYFLPDSVEDEAGEPGLRGDGRDLIREWQANHPGARYVTNLDQLLGLDSAGPVLGLFRSDHMAFEFDRDRRAEPSLSEMTGKAIDLLSESKGGYLLLVEGGRIDHAHHHDDAQRALRSTVELARAVQVAMDRTDPEDTLLIVTSDHGHTMTLSGYPTRGNPILGKVIGNDSSGRPEDSPTLALDGMPFTTLSYASGPSAPRGGRTDLTEVDTTASDFRQPAAVPLSMETHGGADVPSYAQGPMAHLLTGTAEQSYVFNVIVHAADLGHAR